jgi:hypothetical protein
VSRYDKYDPKNGGYRSPLAADYLTDDVERILGVGHDSSGRTVKGAGQSGVTGVLVLTKARKAGEIIDVMTSGEIVEFGPTIGEPGVDFGKAGTVYYSDTAGNVEAGLSEAQTITGGGTISGGTFTITYAGQTTTAIQWNANAATVQAALEALSNLAPGDVVVTGGPVASAPLLLTFGGTLAAEDVVAVTTTSSLTGSSPTLTVATSVAGGGTTGLVRVGHTVGVSRLIVRVEH